MSTPIELAIVDRRQSPRRAVSQMVKLELLDGGGPLSFPGLLVTDISDGGVRLFARDVDIPETFALVFTDTNLRRECRMVWRIGPEVGVEFVEKKGNGAGKRR